MDRALSSWLQLVGNTQPFMLVFFRVLGLFLAAPLVSSVLVPQRYKALLALMLSAAIYPMLRVRAPAFFDAGGEVTLFQLAGLVAVEMLIGLAIGLLASTPLAALEMSGVIMGHQMGLGLAKVYNPEADYDMDVLGQLLFYVATGVFFAMGGLDLLVRGLLRTFEVTPLGGLHASDAPLDMLLGVLKASFELAMRVSTPVAGIILLLIIVFAAVGKTMPQINIMSVGFAIKIVCGMLILSAAVYAIQGAAAETITRTIHQVLDWAGRAQPAGGR